METETDLARQLQELTAFLTDGACDASGWELERSPDL